MRVFSAWARKNMCWRPSSTTSWDGWSNKVIQDDVWSTYAAFTSGQQTTLTPLTLQYSDFADLAKGFGLTLRKRTSIWNSGSSGCTVKLPIIDFPTDRPCQPENMLRTARFETRLLPQNLVRALEKFGQSQNSTLFTLLLTAFGLLLSRYSNQTDLMCRLPGGKSPNRDRASNWTVRRSSLSASRFFRKSDANRSELSAPEISVLTR